MATKLKEMKLEDAAALVLAGIEEILYYYAFPRVHWGCLRTNTRWNDCCARCGEEQESWLPFRMGNQR